MSDVRSRISTHVNIWDREIVGVDLGNIRGGGYLTFRIYRVSLYVILILLITFYKIRKFGQKRPFLPKNRHFWANVGFVGTVGALLIVARGLLLR